MEDGGHVFQNDVYAEIEVMKMVMELRVAESKFIYSYSIFMNFRADLSQFETSILKFVFNQAGASTT